MASSGWGSLECKAFWEALRTALPLLMLFLCLLFLTSSFARQACPSRCQ